MEDRAQGQPLAGGASLGTLPERATALAVASPSVYRARVGARPGRVGGLSSRDTEGLWSSPRATGHPKMFGPGRLFEPPLKRRDAWEVSGG